MNMLKHYMGLIALLISISANSQNITLDKSAGFKSIKLGSSIEPYLPYVCYEQFGSSSGFNVDGVKQYYLKQSFEENKNLPNDLRTVGGDYIKELFLLTFNNKIFRIVITTNSGGQVMDNLKTYYGKPDKFVNNSKKDMSETDELFIWEGNNIKLATRRYDNLYSNDLDQHWIYIQFIDNKIDQEVSLKLKEKSKNTANKNSSDF